MLESSSDSRYRWVALCLAFTAQLSNAMASQAIAPLAPLFQPELGLSRTEVGLFSSAVFGGAWSVLLVAGSFADRFGAGKLMSVGQFIIGALMMLMAAAGSFAQAVAVMVGAGFGSGAVSPGMTKAIVDWFPPRVRATAMGLKQAGVPVAGILAASLLPALGLALGWRRAVALIGLLVICGGAATAVLYRERHPVEQAAASRSGIRVALKVVGRNRQLWSISIIALLFSAGQVALTTYVALYFSELVLVPVIADLPARVVAAGGFLAVCQMGGAFARVFWGVASDRMFRGRRVVVLAIIGALSAATSFALGSLAEVCPLWLLPAIVFACGATSIGWAGLYLAAVAETVGVAYAGTAVGLSLSLIQLGNLGGAPLFGFVVDLTGSYSVGWLFLSCLFGVGTLMAVVAASDERARGIC